MNLIAVFEMRSAWHFLFIFSPFIILAFLWEVLKNRSEKTRYIVGCIIGTMALVIMGIRNINLAITEGFSHDVIPLQICHIGNFVVFFACVFKSKIATSMAFVFHFICAMFSLIFADQLLAFDYGNGVFEITALAYIFGHIFIILGSLYPVVLKLVKFDFKDFLKGMGTIYLFVVVAIILNPIFNNILKDEANFFFLFNNKGVPLAWLYKPELTLHAGWFEINLLYVFVLILFFSVLALGFYYLQKLWYINDKDLITLNIFEERKAKKEITNDIKSNEIKIITNEVHEEIKENKDKKLIIKIGDKELILNNKFYKFKD